MTTEHHPAVLIRAAVGAILEPHVGHDLTVDTLEGAFYLVCQTEGCADDALQMLDRHIFWALDQQFRGPAHNEIEA